MIIIYITADNLVSNETQDWAPTRTIKRVLKKRLKAFEVGDDLDAMSPDEGYREYELIAQTSKVLIYQER